MDARVGQGAEEPEKGVLAKERMVSRKAEGEQWSLWPGS